MKLRTSSILFLAGFILILSSIPVNAESDPSGDVYYFNGVDAPVLWELYGERDYVDVTDSSFSISGSDITVSLTVKDSITNQQNIKYYLVIKTDATSHYTFTYTNEEGIATGNGALSGYVDTNPDYTISVDGKTISYTYSDVDTSLDYTIKSYAVEFLTYGNLGGEAWYDYVPDSEASYYSGENGNKNSSPQTGTPGFEALTVIAALFIGFIILKRGN